MSSAYRYKTSVRTQPHVCGTPFATAAAAILVLAFAATAAGRDWTVAPAGKTGAPGTATAPAELYDAVSRAVAGDSVTITEGNYTADRPIVVKVERLTLCGAQGARPHISASASDRRIGAVVVVQARGCTIRNLEISGGHTYVVKVDSPGCTISDCVLHGSGRDCVKLSVTGDGALIDKCEIYRSGVRDPSNADGIDNVACDDVIVRDCYIHDIATNGVYMKGGARRCIIENNRVTDCGDNGIMLGQSTDRQWNENWPFECLDSVARNNVVENIRGAGLSFEAAKNCRFEGNVVYDAGSRSHGGVSVQENEHHTPCVDVTFDGNTIVMLSDRPMVAVHEGGVKEMKDITCDRNTYYRKSGAYIFSYEPGRIFVRSLAEWQKTTGYDAHSVVAATEPLRATAKTGDNDKGKGAQDATKR